MDFANDSSDFIPSFPGDAPEFSHDEPMGEPAEVGGTGTILSPEPGADNSAKPTVDQIAAAAVLDAAFDSSAPSVAPSPAEPSAETAVGRLLSIDEQLIEQLGVGGGRCAGQWLPRQDRWTRPVRSRAVDRRGAVRSCQPSKARVIDTPCQICESESLIIAGTRMGHICQDCMRELRVIARIHHPTAADVMTLRAERKVKAVT